jgi:hypothetical protein
MDSVAGSLTEFSSAGENCSLQISPVCFGKPISTKGTALTVPYLFCSLKAVQHSEKTYLRGEKGCVRTRICEFSPAEPALSLSNGDG